MKSRFFRMFRWPYLLLIAVIGIAGLFIYPSVAPPFAKKRFITTWVQAFQQYQSKSRLAELPASYRPDLIFIRDFPDGSWVAARSESIHDNEMFDATVFVDSSHAIRASSHHFCGYEGLAVELAEPGASNLSEFYAALDAKKIDLQVTP